MRNPEHNHSIRQMFASQACFICTRFHPQVRVQAVGMQSSKRRKLLAGLGLALVLLTTVAAAVRPALWALGFAFARWRRVALLAYWVGLLVAALPLMDWVSQRRKVPTIIVRKVRSFSCLSFLATVILPFAQTCSFSFLAGPCFAGLCPPLSLGG